jgi:hypothetical protein
MAMAQRPSASSGSAIAQFIDESPETKESFCFFFQKEALFWKEEPKNFCS